MSASTATAVREIIRPGVDGLLVPAEDVAGLASALDQLMRDDALRHRLGNRAREIVSRFSEARVFGQWDAVISGASEEEVGRLAGEN